MLMIVMFLLMGLLINGLYQLLIKGKRNCGDIIGDLPIHESMMLPKSAVKDAHWHIKTFHRPRRKKRYITF